VREVMAKPGAKAPADGYKPPDSSSLSRN
jgi:hypothetical protein